MPTATTGVMPYWQPFPIYGRVSPDITPTGAAISEFAICAQLVEPS
jgi:hypothetical protein